MTTVSTRLVTVVLSIAVSACSRESLVVQTPPPPSGWASSTTTPPSPATPTPSTFSGNLPKALDQMTGKELYDFVVALPRGRGMDAKRKCNGVKCFFSGGKVTVGIEAAADAMYLDDNNAHTNGTIAALAVNKGKYATERYDFKPNTGTVHHTYAFIVFPKGIVSAAKYVVEDIVRVHTPSDTTYSHSTVLAGTFIECNHRIWWTESQAAFQTCDGLMSRGSAGRGIVTMEFDLLGVPKVLLALTKSSARAFAGDDTPGWISCAAGCCTFGSADAD